MMGRFMPKKMLFGRRFILDLRRLKDERKEQERWPSSPDGDCYWLTPNGLKPHDLGGLQ